MTGNQLNRDDKLYGDLVDLKRHLRTCRKCMAARKAMSPHDMCERGIMLVLTGAEKFDVIIKLRVKAHNASGYTVFACPDLSKHGKSYALTAAPLMVTGIQDSLF